MFERLLALVRDPEARKRHLFLRSVPLFAGLGNKELALIRQALTERLYRAGEVVFEEGDASRALLIVESGRVEIYKGKGSEKAVLGAVEPGGYIGEMALVDDAPRSASAAASEDANVLLLHKNKLEGLTHDFPAIGAAIMRQFARSLSDRCRQLEARLLLEAARPRASAPAAESARVAELERALAGLAVELERSRRGSGAVGSLDPRR
jgi:CRP/FNR family cyclic AMP-dependent transcriptional regulator